MVYYWKPDITTTEIPERIVKREGGVGVRGVEQAIAEPYYHKHLWGCTSTGTVANYRKNCNNWVVCYEVELE